MPKRISESAATIWRAEDYRGDENRHKWIRTWTPQEVEWLETAAKAWQASGRALTEIERVRGACAAVRHSESLTLFAGHVRPAGPAGRGPHAPAL